MKRLLLTALLLVPAPVMAQPSQPLTSAPMTVTGNDVAVIAAAVRIAASQCGAANPTACQIGLSEGAITAKLTEADKAIKAADQAAADKAQAEKDKAKK